MVPCLVRRILLDVRADLTLHKLGLAALIWHGLALALSGLALHDRLLFGLNLLVAMGLESESLTVGVPKVDLREVLRRIALVYGILRHSGWSLGCRSGDPGNGEGF